MQIIMDNLIENWFLYLSLLVIIAIAAIGIYQFYHLPNSKKAEKVKEWLLYAVTLAEKELGSGTGRVKLRYVYNLAIDKFPIFTKLISFEDFSKMVDETLIIFNEMIKSNNNIIYYIHSKEV